MAEYHVKIFDRAVWDGNDPVSVEAESEQEAVEKVVGAPVSERGKAGAMCAEVWPPRKPEDKKVFFLREG